MNKFIIVHQNGEERVVNLNWVEEVRPDRGKALIYFAFNGPCCDEQDHMTTDEEYEKVRYMIVGY